jgi:hypothetical protein
MAIVTEAEIFSRLVDPSNPTLTPEVAAGTLQLNYSEADHARMVELAGKSNDGALTPRTDVWVRHFIWDGALLRRKTAVGPTTIAVLNINDADSVAVCQALRDEGLFTG